MAPTGPSVFGQAVHLHCDGDFGPGRGTPTGLVTFLDGSTAIGTASVSGGTAAFTTGVLAVGGHSIKAVYGGDANFTAGVSSVATYTVNAAGTATTLLSSANPSVFGQNVTLTANVAITGFGAGIPTGTVSFKDGATVLGNVTLINGVAVLSSASLSVTSHNLTAVYGGDANFVTSTSIILAQVVNPAVSSTTLVSSANPSAFGQPITLTATVAVNLPGLANSNGNRDL